MNTVKLCEVTNNLDNRRIPLNSTERTIKSTNKLYPYIGANHVLEYIGEYIFNEKILCVAEDGGSWGQNSVCANIYTGKCWVNNHAHVLTAKVGIVLEYLCKYLNYANLDSYITGATRGKLTREKLDSIPIPLPPLDDQKRIAFLLGKVEGMIARRKQHLQQLDDLLKSVFLEMFGFNDGSYLNYKIDTLSSYTDIASGVTKGKKYKDVMLTDVPYLRVANVQDGHFVLDEIKTISVSMSEINAYKLQRGDLLLTEGGDPDKLGRGSVWEEQVSNCIHQNHIFRVRRKNDSEINPYYLSALVGSKYGKAYFLKSAKQTTGIASINSTQLKSFPIVLPPLDLQNKFAYIVTAVESLKSRYQQTLTDLKNLYGTLSQKAFKGDLDLSRVPIVEDVEDEAKVDYNEYRLPEKPAIDFPVPSTITCLADIKKRKEILTSWLTIWLQQEKTVEFSLQEFIAAAQNKLSEIIEDDTPRWNVNDYETVKELIFAGLEMGDLIQERDSITAAGKTEGGNRIFLKKQARHK